MAYSRNELVRDITFFYHECATYGTLYGDLDFWSLLRGPYYEYFQEGLPLEGDDATNLGGHHHDVLHDGIEEQFVQVGSVMLFAAMLVDWYDDSGFAFSTHRGECRHPLPTYVWFLLSAYEQIRYGDSPMRPAFAGVFSLCAHLDQRDDWSQYLEPTLLQELRSVILSDRIGATSDAVEQRRADMYERYIRAYFATRSHV